METNKETIEEILSRGVDEVIDLKHLSWRMEKGDKLRVKLGIDPTSPNLHIGRAVLLLKLKDFQDLGHKVVFIVGDYTATVGDTSDKDSERPMLEQDVVNNNLKTYLEQAGKIIDLKKSEVYFNSKWLAKLSFREVGEMADAFSVADFIARKNIKDRLGAGKRVSLKEVMYPLMQGYDSVEVKADLEIGGTDQRFNLLAGRTLQQKYSQKPQDILTMNLIMGIDGRKMSSSWGNTINLTDSAQEMFGKIMSMPDEIIYDYFIHCTRVPLKQVEEIGKRLKDKNVNPRDVKQQLAHEIVKIYWGEDGASEAQKGFVKVFQDKDIPQDIKKFSCKSKNLTEVLLDSGLCSSKSEIRRTFEQRGIRVNGEVVTDQNVLLVGGDIVQKGKREFIQIQ